MHAPATLHARIDPCSRDRWMAARNPRVVIVGEQMNLRVGCERPRAVEHGPRQQEITKLVALDDQQSHALHPRSSAKIVRSPEGRTVRIAPPTRRPRLR